MKTYVMIIVMIVLAGLSVLNTSCKSINKAVDVLTDPAFLEFADKYFQEALEKYQSKIERGDVEVSPEVPAPVEPPAPADPVVYKDPPAISHGVAYQAIAWNGKTWKQWPSGYFEGGFLQAFDGWAFSGSAAALRDAGGRDMSAAPVLHVITEVMTWAPSSFARGASGQQVPDRIFWRIIVAGGFEYNFIYSHADDVTKTPATVIDHVRGIKVTVESNSKMENGKRVPGYYVAINGERWPTSVRASGFWLWQGNEWGTDPLRTPTIGAYP